MWILKKNLFILFLLLAFVAHAEVPNWSVNSVEYSNSMTFVARVDSDISISKNSKLAAFSQNECRGVVTAQYISQLNEFYFYLVAFNKAGDSETLTFKYYDATTDSIYNISTKQLFQNDESLGSLDDAYVLQLAQTKFLNFEIKNCYTTSQIDNLNQTITVHVPVATNISELIPVFELPQELIATINETIQHSGISSIDFSNPVVYKLTDLDGNLQLWTVSVYNDIIAANFTIKDELFLIEGATISIDGFGNSTTNALGTATFTFVQPQKNLKCEIKTLGYKDSIIYITVSDNDIEIVLDLLGTKNIILNKETSFEAFSFSNISTITEIDDEHHSIAVSVPYGTKIDSLVSVFNLSFGATLHVGDSLQTSNVTANNFTETFTYSVTAEDGETKQEWEVSIHVEDEIIKSTEANILSFGVNGQSGTTTINANEKTISLVVFSNIDLSSLIANFTLSQGATLHIESTKQTSGVTENDYTQTVSYTVIAEDGKTSSTWKIAITPEKEAPLNTETEMLSFTVNRKIESFNIDTAKKAIILQVAYGTDLKNVTALFTLSSGASASIATEVQTSGVSVNDFTNKITYTILAEDGETSANWTVELEVLKNAEAEILVFEVKNQNAVSMINPATKTIYVNGDEELNLSTMVVNFTFSYNAVAYINNVAQISGQTANDFNGVVVYKVVSEDKNTTEYWTVYASKQEPTSLDEESEESIKVYPTIVTNGCVTVENQVEMSYVITSQSGQVLVTGYLDADKNSIALPTACRGTVFLQTKTKTVAFFVK